MKAKDKLNKFISEVIPQLEGMEKKLDLLTKEINQLRMDVTPCPPGYVRDKNGDCIAVDL